MNQNVSLAAFMTSDDYVIKVLSADLEPSVTDLIRRNLQGYEEAGSVIASSFRRLNGLFDVYSCDGARFFVLQRTSHPGQCIGGVGIGPLHGLPPSEGMGEVRDLVLDLSYRGQGHGARLLRRAVEEAKALGYKRLYLETTPQMEKAQKLFTRFGFRPVTQAQMGSSGRSAAAMPSYFILEDL